MTSMPRCSPTNRPMRADFRHSAQSGAPQPLKTQSTAARVPGRASSTTNVGPMSRIQNSSIGASTISTSLLSIRRARFISVGSTTIVTGSNSTIACATAVHAA